MLAPVMLILVMMKLIDVGVDDAVDDAVDDETV
jgi:hypothetical protein